jgi:hypothetical protein
MGKKRGARKSNLISAQAYIMRLFCGACFAEPFFWYIRNAKMDVITLGGVKGGGGGAAIFKYLSTEES